MKIDEIRLPNRPAVTSTSTQYQGSKRNAMVKPAQKATDPSGDC